MENNLFFQRNLRMSLFILLMVVLTVISGIATEFSLIKAVLAIPKSFIWMLNNFIPDEDALTRLPKIINRLFQTIWVSISATGIAAIFALGSAVLGSKTTRPTKWVSSVFRTIASVFRNMPLAVWAMVFLFSFGQNMFTGFLALFFVTYGFLVRVFIESIDEASSASVEALRATGATYFQIITQAVIPQTLPQIISWILFALETNIRSSTLVGILTGTGIGFLFNTFYKSLNYKAAGLVVIAIVAVVLVIDFVSDRIRKIIL